MNKYFLIGIFPLILSLSAFAQDPDETATQNESLKISGFARAKYELKDYSSNDEKLTFDALKLSVKYSKEDVFGGLEYRCYQFKTLCDFSALVDAYVGYNFDSQNTLKFGIQPVVFGPGRFWESNYYGGIVSQVGLADIHNLGLSYSLNFFDNNNLNLGYFYSDGGRYFGHSRDAARYTSNFVQSEPNDDVQMNLSEKNILSISLDRKIELNHENTNLILGGSFLSSTIEDDFSNQDGDRNAWAVYGNLSYKNLAVMLTVGQQRINGLGKDGLVMGSFDDTYTVANDGNFYTLDVNYKFGQFYVFDNVSIYGMLSQYKKENNDNNSSRNIFGVSLIKDKFEIAAEQIIGKNDPSIGGGKYDLAKGDDAKGNLTKINFLYHF